MNMETDIAIRESDLELVVSEKTLGSLTTNAIQIREMVKAVLPKYDIANYNDDNIDQAKKDKAALNKAAKALNAKRLEIEKEFMKPFGEFKEVVTETVKLIGEASAKIDNVVKLNEQQYKDKKKAEIRQYFDERNANLVDFEKVFNPSWLNKTASMKSIRAEIDVTLNRIDSEIESLKGYVEDFDVLRTYYMGTLNLSATLQYANKIQEQRERARIAEEIRRKSEEEANMKAEETKAHHQEPPHIQPQPEPVPMQAQAQTVSKTALYTRAFKVTATKEQIIALGNYMNEHGIDFEKIEL